MSDAPGTSGVRPGSSGATTGTAAWMDGAPLFQSWRQFVGSDAAPFTIPGHKRRADRVHPDLGRLLDADVPLYGGLDTVKLTGGVLRRGRATGRRPLGSRRLPVLDWWIHPRQSGPVPDRRAARGRGACRAQRTPQRSVRSGPGRAAAGLDRGHDRPGHRRPSRSRPGNRPERPGRESGRRCADVHRAQLPGRTLRHSGHHGLSPRPGHPGCRGPSVGSPSGFRSRVSPSRPRTPALTRWSPAPTRCCPRSARPSLVLARTDRIDADRLERAFEATQTTSPSGAILASIDASRAFIGSPEGRRALDAI